MKRPPDDVIAALARLNHTLLPWLQEWRQREMDNLPFASVSTVAVSQGRCQVLTELCRLVQDSPNLSAKPPQG